MDFFNRLSDKACQSQLMNLTREIQCLDFEALIRIPASYSCGSGYSVMHKSRGRKEI